MRGFFRDIGDFETSSRYLSMFDTAVSGYLCGLVVRKNLRVQGAENTATVAPSRSILSTSKYYRL